MARRVRVRAEGGVGRELGAWVTGVGETRAGRRWRHEVGQEVLVSSLQGWATGNPALVPSKVLPADKGASRAPSCSLLPGPPPLPSCPFPWETLSCTTQGRPVALGGAWTGGWKVCDAGTTVPGQGATVQEWGERRSDQHTALEAPLCWVSGVLGRREEQARLVPGKTGPALGWTRGCFEGRGLIRNTLYGVRGALG